jgi:hypothetical protein
MPDSGSPPHRRRTAPRPGEWGVRRDSGSPPRRLRTGIGMSAGDRCRRLPCSARARPPVAFAAGRGRWDGHTGRPFRARRQRVGARSRCRTASARVPRAGGAVGSSVRQLRAGRLRVYAPPCVPVRASESDGERANNPPLARVLALRAEGERFELSSEVAPRNGFRDR